jgi:dihydrofolate reductase
MKISMIVAFDLGYGIGKDGQIPWVRPKLDVDFFISKTVGKPVIMGRKTAQSLNGPLIGRVENIVLSRTPHNTISPYFLYYSNYRDALTFCKAHYEEVMIIGGAEIYKLFFPYTSKLYITQIKARHDCDTWFARYWGDGWDRIWGRETFELKFAAYGRDTFANWEQENV